MKKEEEKSFQDADDHMQEIILVDRELSTTDYEVITAALESFNSLPVGVKSRKMGELIRKQKETARELLNALGVEFSRILAVTSTELSIIKKSLSYFAYIQAPMNATFDRIRTLKKQQSVALNLLEEL
ncbi:MAG: hypothetical protein ACTSP4_01780 [Candidatus Hodarchaeales archaeon]